MRIQHTITKAKTAMRASLGLEILKHHNHQNFISTICRNKLNCKIKFWFRAAG